MQEGKWKHTVPLKAEPSRPATTWENVFFPLMTEEQESKQKHVLLELK